MNSREVAFLALFSSLKEETFMIDYLEAWMKKESPCSKDYHLAHQIAYGSAQMAQALDYLALQVSEKRKLQLKLKERALLRTALYQIYYLDRIPFYAIVDESLKIAKKYFHRYFASYLNAILRKISEVKPQLPKGDDITSLSTRYSYLPSFVAELYQSYGLDVAVDILESGNRPALSMVRIRGNVNIPKKWKLLLTDPVKVAVIPNIDIVQIAQSSDYYIQNVTPAYLIGKLCKQMKKAPKRILDVCASPGGKSLVVHDFFPQAKLYANDINIEKTDKLKENFIKYGLQAYVSCSEGQALEFDEKFDLIILDVPCSNSGVLNKRPEARWRLKNEYYEQLEKLQRSLLEHSLKLLKREGEIWYLTCSILPRENEEMVAQACHDLGLQVKNSMRILPNADGWDGGFATSLVADQ